MPAASTRAGICSRREPDPNPPSPTPLLQGDQMGTSSSAERPQPYRQDILKRVAFLEKIASIKGPFKKDFHRFCSRQIELAQSKNAVDPSKHAWGVVARPDKIMQQFPMRSDECIALAESAVFGWSLSKPVVGFDPELSAALDSQPTGARLQVEALQRLSGNPVFFPGEGECVGSLFFDYVAPYKNEAEAASSSRCSSASSSGMGIPSHTSARFRA